MANVLAKRKFPFDLLLSCRRKINNIKFIDGIKWCCFRNGAAICRSLRSRLSPVLTLRRTRSATAMSLTWGYYDSGCNLDVIEIYEGGENPRFM
jgi:hypothetical protein